MSDKPIRVAGAALAGALLAMTIAACDNNNSNNDASAPKPADNSGVNTRDRNSANPTPTDQGESESDRRIAADIRKAILAQEGMSVNGQNCKIIVRNGAVTLRGPVASSAERDAIETKAKAVAGVTAVTNELEIAPSRSRIFAVRPGRVSSKEQ